MWWLATTSAPRVTATVLLSSAPTARIGRRPATGSGSGSGRSPRDRRSTWVRPLERGPHDRVVAADVDRAVVTEDAVDERGRAERSASSSSWAIGSSLRLPLVITSGRPTPASRRWCSGEYGSSTPEVGQPRGDTAATSARLVARGASTMGRPRRSSSCATAASLEHAELARRGEIGHHHGEGLVVPRLAPAQLGHRLLVGGVDGQVEAADALHGDDPARAQRGDGGPQGRIASSAVSSPTLGRVQRRRGPHVRAGVRLGVEATVAGSSYSAWQAAHIVKPAIVVAGPVVRHRPHDRVARAAVGAVRERVAVPTVGGIVDLRQARRAGGGVDAHRCRCVAAGAAVDDREAPSPSTGIGACRHAADERQRRWILDQEPSQLEHGRLVPLDLDQHPGAVVLHPARAGPASWRGGTRTAGTRRPAPCR